MRCYVCGNDTGSIKCYCPRCRPFFTNRPERMRRRAALIAAYDPAADGFRDHYTDVLLETRDHSDPFFLVFDHLVPVESSKLVASSALLNRMKTDMAPDESEAAFKLLAAHFRGEPFDKAAIHFRYWKRHPPHPPRPARRLYPEEIAYPRVDACVVCGLPPWRGSIYCGRCREFIFWRGYDRARRARAMRAAWSPEAGRFICQYTGAAIEDEDAASPWYLSFDHATPGDRESLVVCAVWVNSMKNALSADEFKAVVMEYDRYLREGGEFDRDVVDFEYWRSTFRERARRPR